MKADTINLQQNGSTYIGIISTYNTQAYIGSRGVIVLILTFSTSKRSVVEFMPQLLNPGKTTPDIH
jgi:hypothetical protein